MKKILRVLVLFLAGSTFTLSSLSHVTGCGGGANVPPASIPAPVSSLITVSPPDNAGFVLVAGDVGSVNANATVIAANATRGGVVFHWEALLIRSALAQVVEATTTADNQGRFTLELEASSGDRIDLRQEVGAEQSAVTSIDVP